VITIPASLQSRPSLLTALDDETWDALRASHLGSVPPELVEAIACDAIQMDVRAGALILRESEASVALVVSGVLRVFMTSPSGRQTTLRYIRRGGLFGVATLFADTAHVGSRALADSRLLVFRSSLLRDAAQRDVRVCLALLRETSERVNGYVNELGGSVFSSVRQRIVRHLLDSAVVGADGATVVATLSQQELADAAGSLRETVVRILRELREAGLVHTGRDGITLLDPGRLEHELWIPGR
jgi:CRP/FNR family transcriptional regulator, cyclic AMP receptor protein